MKNQLFTSFSRLWSHEKTQKSPELIKEIFSVLAYYSDDFLKERTNGYLYKLAQTHSILRENFSSTLSKDIQRNFHMKFLAVKFNDSRCKRKVLGIVFSFHFLSEYEKFGYKHLSKILKRILPGVHILEDSFFLCSFHKKDFLFCYLEIEKIRGKNLSFQECYKLKRDLPREIEEGIELSAPKLFIPPNEEETFRNILRLNKEMVSPKDRSHVIISFQEQDSKSIKFSIILVRILKPSDPFIKKLLLDFPVKIHIQIQRQERLKNKYIKETSVFSMELKTSLFLRKDYSIDLLKARQYICMMLNLAIGEFRDYNGGLLSKQTEQFDLIKKTLSKQIRDISSFEELFYSLSPSNIQLLISSQCALDLCKIFYDLKQSPLEEPYDFRSRHLEGALFVLIKTNSSLYDSIFDHLSSDLLIAYTSKNMNGERYHCLIQIHPIDLSLVNQLRKRLTWIEQQLNLCSNEELKITFQHMPPSFHPQLSTDIRSLTLCKALFEGLTRINPKGEVEFALAKDIKISPCGKRYVFFLRSSKWSNGEELTSYDFAKSWRRALAHNSNCIRAKNFFLIKNAKKAYLGLVFLEEVGIFTPSEKKLVVELEYTAPHFLQLLADPMFSPLYGTDINEEPTVFNGPFLPASQKKDDKMELIYNPIYWDMKSVKLKQVTIFFIKNSLKAYEMYQQKKLDWIGSPFNSLSQEILKKEPVQSYEINAPFWVFCNSKNPKLKSIKIRQALSLVIDREQFIKNIFPLQAPSYTIIPKNLSNLTVTPPSKKDLKKALSLFEEGLKEVGFSRNDFSLNISHSDVPEQKQLAHFLKTTWEKTFNITIYLQEDSWNSHWNTVFNQEYEIAGFFSYTTHEGVFHFMDFFEYAYNNYAAWENKDYQKYLSSAKNCTDQKQKKDLLRKAETILNHEMPVIPIYNHTPLYLSNPSIKNFILPKFGYSDFKWAYFND